MVTALITVAAIAWLTQLAFGGWQIRRFNRAFDSLCQQGRVGVGRSSGALNRARLSLSPSMKTIVFAIRC
jgi:DNA-binding transcriptional regulator of glucitol operon